MSLRESHSSSRCPVRLPLYLLRRNQLRCLRQYLANHRWHHLPNLWPNQGTSNRLPRLPFRELLHHLLCLLGLFRVPHLRHRRLVTTWRVSLHNRVPLGLPLN